MKPAELKDGAVYRLTRDVRNPAPDRRYTRHWTAAPVWQKGLRVVASIRPEPRNIARVTAKGFYDNLGPGSDGWAELVEALEPAPRTFESIMFGINQSPSMDYAYSLLNELVRQGKLTLDDIETAYAAYHARIHAEDDAS